MLGALRQFHNELKARIAHYFRVREIVRAFSVAHAKELTETTIENLPMVRARQRLELEQVRAGNLNIVDRKSWQYPFMPATVQRLSMPVMKTTPYNLRRFSRTPVARRAINLIKNSIIQQPWDIRAKTDAIVDDEDEQNARIATAKKIFSHPNNSDSHQTWIEMGIEDMCILGAFACELTLTPDPRRPLKMWVVNVESIRIFVSWSESTTDLPHYAQMTGLQGERGAILFYDDELMYIRDNPASDNPFGLGKLEVAFSATNDLLGVQKMAGMAGSDQVHKTWLWWEQPQSDSAYQIVRRHIQNEMEGQAKVSIIGGMKKPEVVEIMPVTEDDLLLNWQEMLIRMIANGFDMSPMSLGVERDVNRSTGEVLQDNDFRSAVVPMAKRLQEAFTRKILHEKLGWSDLEFVYLNLDDPDLTTKTDLYRSMYSANAITPNEWRRGVNMQPLESPFGDLTQFECMLLNMEAMQNLQNQAAQQAQQNQIELMQHQAALLPPQPDPNDPTQGDHQNPDEGESSGSAPQPGAGGGAGGGGGMGKPGGPAQSLKMTPGNVARGGQPQSPKAMALPKFPVAGSKYNAKQIANMPVNQIADLINSGELPDAPTTLQHMQNQEPSILEQMTDEVREFFESQEQEQEQEKEQKQQAMDKKSAKWAPDLKKRVRKNAGRITDMTQYLQKIGHDTGKPGSRSRTRPYRGGRIPGKPGTPPPPRGI